MIAFNGQYLPAASHGNMRITAACLGGQLVLGNWLMTATAQAIIAAFGREEGIAVIIRTNDYLNALALTDQTRAQQLAMFINEDPLLVTSLVETSKTRWLVGDGKAYINTGWIPKQSDFAIRTRFSYSRVSTTNMVLYGNAWNAGSGIVFMHGVNNSYIQTFNSVQRQVALGIVAGARVDMEHTKDSVTTTINGATKTSKTNATYAANNLPIWLFHKTNGTDELFDGLTAYWQVESKDVNIHYVPFNNGTECGMLDLVTYTFHPNANTTGQFTIAITDKE